MPRVADAMAGRDYAGAVTVERRGQCYRLVYDQHEKPTVCPEPITHTDGLYLSFHRKWYPVDSCERHVTQLRAALDLGKSRPAAAQ